MNVDGFTLPFVHVSGVDAEIVKLRLHDGAQLSPCNMPTLLHEVALVTMRVVQSWWLVNVDGVKVPSLHVSTLDVEIAKPDLHDGIQLAPCTMLTLLRADALLTARAVQSQSAQHILEQSRQANQQQQQQQQQHQLERKAKKAKRAAMQAIPRCREV